MKLKNIMIIILLTSLMIVSSINFLGQLSTNYEEPIAYGGLNQSINKTLKETISLTEQISTEIQSLSLESDSSNFDIPYILLKAGWLGLKLTFKSVFNLMDIIRDSFNSITTNIGAPEHQSGAIILGMITAIIIVSVVFILISAYYKWKFED